MRQSREATRKYHRGWYAAHAEQRRREIRDRRRRLRDMVFRAKQKPCADCKQEYPHYVMDFDHLDGDEKVASPLTLVMLGASEARIMAEMAKCEVVCANCHRVRTWSRRQRVS